MSNGSGEDKEFWRKAEARAAEVRAWPAWKRGVRDPQTKAQIEAEIVRLVWSLEQEGVLDDAAALGIDGARTIRKIQSLLRRRHDAT